MKPTITPEQVREWLTHHTIGSTVRALCNAYLRQHEALEVAKEALKSFGPGKLIHMEHGIINNTARVHIDEVRKLHIALSRIDAIMKEVE